ncbi:S41 family peptidase [Roseateles oligotrophus]|uniref:Tricorn protease homolog n=1 Tax=Roseateles oligotrophus TaxID=1769250 RepID=A0ABT2YER9_9BURK|nr:S41 family peptidase [Roseateles oligotrophus]MCV2368553.1 PDZ domain-containing protein [Roseateles oligotrophus]
MKKLRLLAAACLVAMHAPLLAQAEGFYRQPALRGNQLYFVAEGDIWRAQAQGGQAQRLTTHPGAESMPAVSADGQWLAFVAQYDGPGDVYVMPAQGGLPKRLSWEGSAQRVWGFSSAGEVIYSGPSQSGQPISQLYAVDPKTQQRRALPVGQASDGALSADGKRLYFTRNGLRGDNARQYRGGAIARLWSLELNGAAEAKPLIAEGANDSRPMPYRIAGPERIAFLSDRDGTVNLWSVNAEGQDLRQHSRFKGWDIRHASIDGTKVSVAVGADIYLLDFEGATAGQGERLKLSLSGDFDQQRERWIKKPQDFLTDTAMAPNGERVLLASRGRLATQGIGALRRAELMQPADGRCRKGVFSADSTQVFALCDFSGEREIWRLPANGLAAAEQITFGAKAMRTQLLPSPDGRFLAHTDKEGQLFLTDLKASGAAATSLIGHDKLSADIKNLTWSPDSQVLAFTQPMRANGRDQVRLYKLADGKTHTVSSDRYESEALAFTPDGRWLYFASQRSFAVTGNGGPWGDRNMGPFFDKRSKLYALALQPGLSFPFAPKDELTPAEAKADSKPDTKTEAKPATKPAIVWAGLAERLFEVPLPAANYSALRSDGKRLWWLESELGAERKSSLKTVSIDRLGASPETVATDVREFDLSVDGKKLMLVRAAMSNSAGAAPEILLVEAAPKLPTETAKFQVKWSDWQIATDPKLEWQQMFADGWRMHRDYFYDKAMHGVDWLAMRAKYEPLVARVTDRLELAELMAQMVGELSALHSQVNAGDVRAAAEEPGLAGLGAQLMRAPNGWRIDQIYRSDPELPSEASPLAAPGLNIQLGDVITAINGRKALDAAHPSELLRGQAGKQVLLQLRSADGKDKQAVVTPVAQRREQQMRFGDWRYARGRAVEAASEGRIGYLHLRAMGRDDIADFAREFYAQADREGLIIDVRFNGGGNIDSWILEKLLRRAWAYWQRRSPDGAPASSNMQHAFRGHLVVLANEETYSDGETFAEGIKRLGLAPVIGKTTSGAGVWLSDQNRLMDNGIIRAAETGQMTAEGQFIIEGVGVKPDIEVDNPPRATFLGGDAQLDAAIAHLKQAMAAKPRVLPKPGAYPRPIQLP